MSKTKNKFKDSVCHLLKKMVDEFFDVCADSDVFKGKVVTMILKQPKFKKKLARELKNLK
ncbi:MAG: hypothetical protein Q8M83_00775 [bacterium]|nr:hypothetical protein [bacterium]